MKQRPGFDRRMTKEEINQLPIQGYGGETMVVRNSRDLSRAVKDIRNESLLGFDTETRPSFWKGKKFPPALIQLAGHRSVFIFQLRHTGLPPDLREILEDPAIIKTGVSISHDINELKQLAPFTPAGFVDLAAMAREKGIKNHGLRGLAAVLLGIRIAKGNTRKSNWANDILTPTQIRYAATDAWVGREIYQQLVRI